MTQVDFYVLETPGHGDRLQLCCRLAEKAWSQGHRILVHCASAEEAQRLDRLLWVFRDQSFVPHGRLGEVDPGLTPVLIAHAGESGDEHDVLINLAPDGPTEPARFGRICEVVGADEDTKRRARLRWRNYADAGLTPTKHDL